MSSSANFIQEVPFGKTAEGEETTLFILTNKNGFSAAFTNYGATWVRWNTPDRNGKFEDILLGFDNVENYIKQTAYIGAVCGRHANRIAGGKFYLRGEHQLAINNGPNHLHGGVRGFDRYVWQATTSSKFDEHAVTFRRLSPDGEENYPGNVNVAVTYTLLPDGTIRIFYSAESDQPTILNLTNHSYFNLAGQGNGDCSDHQVKIHGKHYLPVDADNIPTGEIRSVDGTIFDFRKATLVGKHNDDKQLSASRGYDHTFIVEGAPEVRRPAAEVTCPRSGRVLVVETTEPTVHLYTANWLNECVGDIPGKGGATYKNRAGLALETQHAPDSPNQPAFRSIILRPGCPYTSTTKFRISAQ
ncbi:MAG: galactose mutarotase [Puniceicoccales bacterium]|jgi:aldose 1-epimerase|nr:galactose mutarotase [Puniceicoccales bacterium]